MIKRKLALDREILTSEAGKDTDPAAGVFPGPTGCFCTFLDCTFGCPTILPDTDPTGDSDIYC